MFNVLNLIMNEMDVFEYSQFCDHPEVIEFFMFSKKYVIIIYTED